MEMRKSLLPIVMLLMTAGAAQAGGLVTKHASSVQLTVDAARHKRQELVLHSVSQDQILILLTGQLQAQFLQALSPQVFIILALLLPHRTQHFPTVSRYTQGDALPTSAATVGTIPNFGSVTSYTAGTKDTLAGTVTSAGVLTVTAGGAGTTATGQFVSEITVID